MIRVRPGLLAIALLAPASAPASGEPGVLRFLAFGDGGFGSRAQYAVGEAMGRVCAARGCDFALMMGDNFYPSGVTAADDPQFEAKFEKPYAPLRVPVYAVLGNHDNGVNGDGASNDRGQFQVQYHYRTDRLSGKWQMPARYYSVTLPSERVDGAAPLAELFALDSSPMAAYRMDPDLAWHFSTYGVEQLVWFRAAVQRSRARWKIALAHHTYVSNGGHGNAGSYTGSASKASRGHPWKAFVERSVCADAPVDLFFQGHDHDLQWIRPLQGCGRTQFFVSGAVGGPAAIVRRNVKTYWQRGKTLGFFWFELREDRMTGAAYTLETAQRPDGLREFSLPADADGRPLAAFERTAPRD